MDRDKLGRFIKGSIPHSKGKTKENYEPLRRASKELSEVRKRLIKEGKIKSNGEILRRLYAEGKLINPNKGKKSPWTTKRNLEDNPLKRPEVREKIRLMRLGKTKENSEWTKKISETKKRLYVEGKLKSNGEILRRLYAEGKIINPMQGKKHKKITKQKIRNRLISNLKNGLYNITPNKPEKIIINLIKENNLPFNYVGDGKIWFRGENHSFNPDFLSKNPKHIIEVFGDYWHNLPKVKERDKKRIDTYAKYGYKTLVIWEHELKNPPQIIDKIRDFMSSL